MPFSSTVINVHAQFVAVIFSETPACDVLISEGILYFPLSCSKSACGKQIPYTSFVMTVKPIGEMEAVEPGFISSLQLQKTTLSSLAKVCKDRLKLKVTNGKRDEAKNSRLIV